MLKKIAFGLVVFCGLTIIAKSVLAFDSPGDPQGPINDFAALLSSPVRRELTTFLTEYEKNTTNAIIVVTVPSLNGEVIENYAVDLFKSWGIGREKRDNGVLLLIAPNEREARIEVGYGLEGEVTDLESGQIINKILIPAFKQGDYDGGVSSSVHAIVDSINGDYQAPATAGQDDITPMIIFLIIFALFIFLRIYGKKKGWKGGGPGAGPIIGGIIGGGFGGGGGGSSFGGFGGGSSGGGGASGRW